VDSGCRVGELVKLKVRDFRTNGEHRVLNVTGKGNKEGTTPLHPEAVERLAAWLEFPGIRDDAALPLFRPQRSARNHGRDGFRPRPMTSFNTQARSASTLRIAQLGQSDTDSQIS